MILILIILLFNIYPSHQYQDDYDCRNTVSGKKPGNAFAKMGNKVSSAHANYTVNSTNITNCFTICINDTLCQLADHDNKTENCNIYYSIPHTEYDHSDSHDLFFWKFCDMSVGVSSKELTNGFWFYYVDTKLIVDQYLYTYDEDFPSCKARCRDNSLCGGFNYLDAPPLGSCQLLVIWTGKVLNMKQVPKWRGYYWVLQNKITYQVQDEYCRKIKTKACIGMWEIKNSTVKNVDGIITKFQTRNFTKCYRSCEFYENCRKVIFHYPTSKCILIPSYREKCVRNETIPQKNVVVVEWKCCDKRGSELSVTSSEYRKCHVIMNPKYVTLIPFRCTRVPPETNENCFSRGKKVSLFCAYGQNFQSTEKQIGDYLLIFNGYQTFLLKNATAHNFPQSTYEMCALYNAKIPTNPTLSLTTAANWYSIPINENNLELTLPVSHVIVGELNHTNCLCFEWLQCVEIIRQLQNKVHKEKRMNLQFHFMISPNGDVFEGRGWNQQTKMFERRTNADSYYVAFLGDYLNNLPTIQSIHAFKSLIRYGVLRKFIAENYYLITDHDYNHLRFGNFRLLYNVIQTQARYRGLEKEYCLQISPLVTATNGLLVLIITGLLIAFSYIIFHWGHTSHCKSLQISTSNDSLHRLLIHPISDYTKMLILYNDYFRTYAQNTNYTININNSIIFWITEFEEMFICRACTGKISQTITLYNRRGRPIESTAIKLVVAGCDKETVCVVFEAQTVMSKTVVILVHLTSDRVVAHLKTIISSMINRKCICSTFKMHRIKADMAQSKFHRIVCDTTQYVT